MHLMGRDQSRYNPRFCQQCERFEHPGGAVVDLTMFFADVRGSTQLAEQLSAHEFSHLINRFYLTATDVLARSDAFVDRLIGEEAVGLFVPAAAGTQHARRAIEAAQELLSLTGHGTAGGSWLVVGIGIHTGSAWVSIVGGEAGGPMDFTALGDNVNVTARLASSAQAGEILVSQAAYAASQLDLGELEYRQLELKGKSEAMEALVLHYIQA